MAGCNNYNYYPFLKVWSAAPRTLEELVYTIHNEELFMDYHPNLQTKGDVLLKKFMDG
jgi:hypothetical protein